MLELSNPLVPHSFTPSKKDHTLCDTCGLSKDAVVHPKHQLYQYYDLSRVPEGGVVDFDPVEAPAHYCQHKTTTAQLVVDWKLDFFLGNVLKYIERHQLKAGLEDLKKARNYLEMEIEFAESGKLERSISHG